MKMRPIVLVINAAALAGAHIAAPVSAGFVAVRRNLQAAAQSLHTAIYTTTVDDRDSSPQIVTTVVVTLLMPAEDPRYPSQGAPITGTAISHFSASPSSWDKTAELYWTLSGNVPLGVDSTIPPLVLGATTTLTSVHTWTDSHTSTYVNLLLGRGRYEWFTTARVTFIEGVGPVYPATIIRTGYTDMEVTQTGGNEAVGTTHRNVANVSYWRTTTMVQVLTSPTPLPSVEE